MRTAFPLTVLVLAATAACAGRGALAPEPSRVRDPSGRPLPTTARIDADTGGTELHCDDGSRWTIVEPPRAYLAGAHLATHRVVITDAPALCARIRATL